MSVGDDRRQRLLVAAGLVGIVLLCYFQVVRHDFVSYDDGTYVARNPHVRAGLTWESVQWAFTTTQESNWHPLTWISILIDADLYGIDPGKHHMTSVLLHAANAVLLFLAFARMTGQTWAPALVAALFAIHPLRVESVAWASARKDVLSGFFFFLTILAYARYARRGRAIDYALSLGAFLLGLLSKPMLVTAPFVLLLLDVWPLRRASVAPASRAWAKLLREKIPFVALAAASAVVTYVAQRQGGSVLPWESIPPAARVANAAVACLAYLGKAIWPAHLAVLYPHPALAAAGGLASLYARGAVAAAVLAASLAAVWLLRAKRPYLAVGWLWYLGMLVPVLGIVQVGIQGMADRYTYLPLIGIHCMIAWALADAIAARPAVKPFVQIGASACLVGLAALTWAVQVPVWKDSIALYRHAVAVTTGNYAVHNNLGSVLPENSPESEAEYRRAIEIQPRFPDAHYNLGTVLDSRGDLAGARAEYEAALAIKPDWFEARNNLANDLAALGDEEGAIAQWRELLRRDPGSAAGHLEIGKLLAKREQWPAAIAELEEAVRLAPGAQEALVALAEAREKQGMPGGVADQLAAAARMDPGNFQARFNAAVASLREGRPAEAERQLRPLVEMRPDDPQVRNGLAIALASQGKLREAETEFVEALRLDPTFGKASQGLDKVRRLLAARAAGGATAPRP